MADVEWREVELGPQDRLNEFAFPPGQSASTARAYEKNKDLTFAAGTTAWLPYAAPSPRAVEISGANTYGGSARSFKVKVRLKAVLSDPPAGAFQAGSTALKAPDASLGFAFRTAGLSTAGDRTTEEPLTDRSTGEDLFAGELLEGTPKLFQVRPKTTSDEHYAGDSATVALSLRRSRGFLEVLCELADGEATELAWRSGTAPMVRIIQGRTGAKPEGPLFNFSASLGSAGDDERTFEIEYRLRPLRGLIAWHSARVELVRGLGRHGEGTWETWGDNRGPLINEYVRYLRDSVNAAMPTDYVDWVQKIIELHRLGPYANNAMKEFSAVFAGSHPEGNPWCGYFVGFHHKRAGFDCRGSCTIAPINGRHDICSSTIKCYSYVVHPSKNRPRVMFERAAFDSANRLDLSSCTLKTREQCTRWLTSTFNPWGPEPGDVILVNASRVGVKTGVKNGFDERYNNHFAMVSRYDPKTFMLEAYEGNADDRAHGFRLDLSAPEHYHKVYCVTRFTRDDYRTKDGAGERVPPTRWLEELMTRRSAEPPVGAPSSKSV